MTDEKDYENDENGPTLTSEQEAAVERIQELKSLARDLIKEATAVADKAKVAFHISMFQMRNTYVAEGAELDEDGDEVYREYGEDGWQTSSC